MNENPFEDLLNILTEPQPLLEFPEGRGIKRKEEPWVKSLPLTLSEVHLSFMVVPSSFTFCTIDLLLFYYVLFTHKSTL